MNYELCRGLQMDYQVPTCPVDQEVRKQLRRCLQQATARCHVIWYFARLSAASAAAGAFASHCRSPSVCSKCRCRRFRISLSQIKGCALLATVPMARHLLILEWSCKNTPTVNACAVVVCSLPTGLQTSSETVHGSLPTMSHNGDVNAVEQDKEEEHELEDESEASFDSESGKPQVRRTARENMESVCCKRMGMTEADAKAFVKRHVNVDVEQFAAEQEDDCDDLEVSAHFSGISTQPDGIPARLKVRFQYHSKVGYAFSYVHVALRLTFKSSKDECVFWASAESEHGEEVITKDFVLSNARLQQIRQAVFGEAWPMIAVLEMMYAATGVIYSDGDQKGLDFESVAVSTPADEEWLASESRKAAGCASA